MSTEEPPKGWKRVKFGDVVRNVNENARDLAADGLDRVVGLDHLDPGSLRLARWEYLNDLPDGTTFTRKFKPGQVLFGKRRSYQRKAAVPVFEGVCSGDILVFEPNDKRMLAEFLPYLVQSDGFFDHALGTSAGSLSPRTKWAELAKYEFALPPLNEQQRLVTVFSSFDKEQSALRDARTAAAVMRLSALQALDETTETRCRLGDLVDLERGVSYKSSDYVEEGTGRPFLNLKCVTRQGTFSARGVKWVRSDFTPGSVVSAGELFFANTDLTPGRLLVGAPFFFRGLEAEEEPCFSMDLTRVRLKATDVPVELVYHLLKIPRVRAEMRRLTGGSTVGHLRLGGVPIIEVPLVSDELPVLARLRSLEALEDSLADREDASRSLAASAREWLLGGGSNVQ